MAENNTEEVVEQAEEVKEEPVYSEVEQKAMSKGWRPQDQWEGDPDDWISAKEFVSRQSFFDKIDSQNKKYKELERTLHDFKNHYQNVQKTAYEKALKTLKEQKRQALKDDDTATALEIEDRLDELEQNKPDFSIPESQKKGPSEAYLNWVKDNSWYTTNKKMQGFADSLGMAYVQANPSASEQEVFEYVENEMRESFPNLYEKKSKVTEKISPVDGGGHRTTSKSTASKRNQLPPDARAMMEQFVKMDLMTEEDYIKDYFGE